MAIFLLCKLYDNMTTAAFSLTYPLVRWTCRRCIICLLIAHTLLTSHGVASIPVALFSERYAMRRWPFIFGIVIVICSQILLMEAKNYSIMCVAQLAQGIGSSLVWVVGLAIL